MGVCGADHCAAFMALDGWLRKRGRDPVLRKVPERGAMVWIPAECEWQGGGQE